MPPRTAPAAAPETFAIHVPGCVAPLSPREEIPDVPADCDYAHGSFARIMNFRSIVAVAMLKDERPIEIANVGARSSLGTAALLAGLCTMSARVIYIEKVRGSPG
jgi:hypothetical protein